MKNSMNEVVDEEAMKANENAVGIFSKGDELVESFVKFIYSEKATKFCEIFTLLLTGTTYILRTKVQIILFEIDCAIIYTNFPELFCQFIS